MRGTHNGRCLVNRIGAAVSELPRPGLLSSHDEMGRGCFLRRWTLSGFGDASCITEWLGLNAAPLPSLAVG